MTLEFPGSFVFGAATSAYQIEGAVREGGRGPSIWDDFCARPGAILDGTSGAVACDHYHRYREDVQLMSSLSLDAYRFSVAWPRILPDGRGATNPGGLDFYQRLVDTLLEAGITPFVTLYHWDLPVALQRSLGGFASRDCGKYFADYAEQVALALGDRVTHFITLNEPQIHGLLGHCLGIQAPGRRRPWSYLRVMHHQLLAHGWAVQAIKGVRPESQVGITLQLIPIHPRSETDRDRVAADFGDQLINRVCLDPLFKGCYPRELSRKFAWFQPRIESGDMEVIGTPLDFLGLNNYTRELAYHAWYIPWLNFSLVINDIPERAFVQEGVQYTSMGWEVYPDSLYQLLTRAPADYGHLPLYVTENGAAFDDLVARDGAVHDAQRTAYLQAYLGKVRQAIEEGVQVRGYFVWSLLDNFEWSAGLAKRFGIVYVDYRSQRRIVKDSGGWYRDLIRAQAR